MKYLKTFEAYDLRDLPDYINVCIAMFAPKEYYKIINISICEMCLKSSYDKLEFYTQDPEQTSNVGKPFFGTIKNGDLDFSGVRESLLDGKNWLYRDKGLTCEAEYQKEVQFAIVGFDEDGYKQIEKLIGNQFKIRSESISRTPGIWGKDIKHPLFNQRAESLLYSWDLDFPEKEEEFGKAFSFVNKFAVPTFIYPE